MTDFNAELVVIGSGPGGYTAAFRAADLGKKVILVEYHDKLGGVCLNVGCIPSKALLHAAKILEEAETASEIGINFGKPQLDIDKLNQWKDKNVVARLTGGLKTLAKQRQIQVIQGQAKFIDDHRIEIISANQDKITVTFDNAIIAVGSSAIKLPFMPEDERIIDSTAALKLTHTSGRMLVIGGGIIGLEMATVYHALGSKITVVEAMDQLIASADQDIVAPLHKFIAKKYEAILLETKVTQVIAAEQGLTVTFEGKDAPEEQLFDQILVAVGRKPNGALINAEKAGVNVDQRGFITVDKQMRTNVSHIFAIGDVVGNPMLAHKASYEGKIAAEVIAGKNHYFNARVIPSVAYTDPEVAWVGVTETEAKQKGLEYGKGSVPWAVSGRALSLARTEGLTKILFDRKSNRVIGAGIVGPNAGELISELALAIEMGCDAEDIALTIHPHPTLSETVMLATEVFEGTITDLYLPKKTK